MKCYMIVLGAFTDFERFMGGATQVLEGDWTDGGGAVISEWPDRAAALRFWNSPEYAVARQLREGTGRFQVVLVDAEGIGAAP